MAVLHTHGMQLFVVADTTHAAAPVSRSEALLPATGDDQHASRPDSSQSNVLSVQIQPDRSKTQRTAL